MPRGYPVADQLWWLDERMRDWVQDDSLKAHQDADDILYDTLSCLAKEVLKGGARQAVESILKRYSEVKRVCE